MLGAIFLRRNPISGERLNGLSAEKKIVVSKDGPYLVSKNIPLSMQIITPNEEGFSWE